MITVDMVPQLFGDEVYDREGQRIGKVGQVYLDQSGRPVWVTVKTGLFGTKETVVPLSQARLDGDELRLQLTKDQVKEAPRIDTGAKQMSPQEEREIHRYYGLPHDSSAREQRTGRDRDDSMTVSEERLRVSTEPVEAGQARLRKYVVTEQQQVTVPVRHEEVRVEREPITDARGRTGDVQIGEEEQVEKLYAERPVVRKEATPVERVRLAKQTVTDEQTVSDEVRKERVEVHEDASREPRR